MKAIKCDICKNYFDGVSTSEFVKGYRIGNHIEVNTVSMRGHRYILLDEDICPECYAAIMEVIDSRRKSELDAPN